MKKSTYTIKNDTRGGDSPRKGLHTKLTVGKEPLGGDYIAGT